MTYTPIWSEGAKNDLHALGKAEYVRIVKKVESHLARDPAGLGKPLGGSLSGLYRYRIGDYRVIY
jgi:mRNA interferase RelE/StbE